jgi:hypothetical protein
MGIFQQVLMKERNSEVLESGIGFCFCEVQMLYFRFSSNVFHSHILQAFGSGEK